MNIIIINMLLVLATMYLWQSNHLSIDQSQRHILHFA